MSKSEDIALHFGQAIREQRQTIGLSQQEVADLAGVSVNLLRQVEAGKPSAQLKKVLDIITAVGLQFILKPGNNRIVIMADK